MGGRGAGGVIGAYSNYNKKSERYEKNYEPFKRGQITKYEAGVLYRNVKNNNVNALPEFVSRLYDETNNSARFASERYSQDSRYYDSVEGITHSLINEDYKTAQKLIDEVQKDLIKRSGRKSPFYKYRK